MVMLCVLHVLQLIFLSVLGLVSGQISNLIQIWKVVVTVVLIFHQAILQLLIQAFEGTEIACWHQISLIPYFL